MKFALFETLEHGAQNEQDDKSVFAFGLSASMRYPPWTRSGVILGCSSTRFSQSHVYRG